jgi:hypothetical protein
MSLPPRSSNFLDPTSQPVAVNGLNVDNMPGTRQTSKGHGKKGIFVVLSLALLTLIIAVAYAATQRSSQLDGSRAAAASDAQSPTKNVLSEPATAATSVLVFESTSTPVNTTMTLVGLDGTMTQTISSGVSSSTFDGSIFSQENLTLLEGNALMTSDNSLTQVGLLGPTGKSVPVATSLYAPLFGAAKVNSPAEFTDEILLDKSTLLALKQVLGTTDLQYVEADLLTGATATLLTAKPIPAARPGLGQIIQPVTASLDGKIVYLLTDNAFVNSTPLPGVSLIAYNRALGTYEVHSLPSGEDIKDIAISKSGDLVAYQVTKYTSTAPLIATHIFTISTGKDVILPGEGLFLTSGGNNLRFSPDGAYLYEVGGYYLGMRQIGMALQIFSMAQNVMVQHVELVGTENQLTCFGWAGEHNVIYITNTSATGNYDPMVEATHSINVLTGKIFNFAPRSGSLLAVLNF